MPQRERPKPPPFSPFARPRSAAAALDMRLHVVLNLLLKQRYRIVRVLEIRLQVGRGAAWESPDVRILHDRLVEVEDHRLDQRQRPAVVLARIPSRRRGQHPRRCGAVEGHVVFLVRIHGEVVAARRSRPGLPPRPARSPSPCRDTSTRCCSQGSLGSPPISARAPWKVSPSI